MVEALVNFALRQRIAVAIAACVIIGFGIRAVMVVPIEAYPDVGDTQVLVISQWQGHAAEEVERHITIPMERIMNTCPHQVAVRSVSIAGLSVVTITFADGTNDWFARQQALERLQNVELPPGVNPTLGPLASPIGEIMRYRLINCSEEPAIECSPADEAAEPLPLTALKDLEEWVVERELLRIDGVADVASFGGTMLQYQVRVDPGALAARGFVLEDVIQALAEANGTAGGNVVALGPEALNVRAVGLLQPDEIADVSIGEHDGTPIRVRDIATVERGYQPRLGRVSVGTDDDVVAATILLRRGDDAQVVLGRVHERVEELNTSILPIGVRLHPYHDRSHLMELTTHTVTENLLAGIGLVTIILFVFLGSPRAAFIVSLTIPLSLLVAFIGMDAADIPANLLSIGAVDFGMIVDGSIVMVENIFRLVAERQERGERGDIRPVVKQAAHEVARPIVFAIGIIVASYLPIFTLERVEGRLFRPMAFTVAFALFGALVLAITLVPMISTFLLNRPLKEMHNPLLAAVRRVYLPAIDRLLRRPHLVLVVALALLAGDAVMYRALGSEFLPHLNEGAMWVRASMPGNISLAEAEGLIDGHSDADGTHVPGMRELLGAYPEVETMAVQVGRPDDGLDPSGFFNAEFLLILHDRSEWREQFHGDRDALTESMSRSLSAVPGVTFGFSQPISDNVEEALTGVKGQLAIKISGTDLHALDDLATRIAHEVGQVPGVADLGIFREVGQSNLHVEISRERAERVGLTVQDVEEVVEAGIGGLVVTRIVEEERWHDLVVRYREDARDSIDSIRRLPVPTDSGHTIPLGEIATVEIQAGASRIYRENGRRYIAIKFSVRERDLGSTVAEAQARVDAAVTVPEGYNVAWGGEFESAQRAGRRLSIVIPLTILTIFVLLFAMFRRPREALIILGNVLITSPFGGLAALLLTHTNLSVSAGVGFLALFGVSVQTGVILVAYVNELRAEGLDLDSAIRKAVDMRLRPIMMTALVATLGLLPAALSNGIGSDSQKPLAIVVVGGLLSSLSLSLFVLPLLCKLFGGPAVNAAGMTIPPPAMVPDLGPGLPGQGDDHDDS
jgi:cobalt-zinc-cadmium resistance protein CzcA